MAIKTRRVVARIVLDGSDLIKWLRISVVQVEIQTPPVVVMQRHEAGMIVGYITRGAHKQLEYLLIIESR